MAAQEWIFPALLLVAPVLMALFWMARIVRDARAARGVRRQAAQREAARRPAAGTIVVEGVVCSPSDGGPAARIVKRRQFGCLGGPIVFNVPRFELELPSGRRLAVDAGPDPLVENLEGLFGPACPEALTHQQQQPPAHTGSPDAVVQLSGWLRISGVLMTADGSVSPPEGHSATIVIMRPH